MGDQSIIMVEQIVSVRSGYYKHLYHNDSHSRSFGFYLGGGYQWKLSPLLSLSLGGRISHHSFQQNGNEDINLSYNYKINATNVNTVLRLSWIMTQRNLIYGEFSGGVANLTSQDFHLTTPLHKLQHKNKTVRNIDYSIGDGWMYRINSKTNLNVMVSYQNLGDALLGVRIVPKRSDAIGNVKQSIGGMNATIGIVRWF